MKKAVRLKSHVIAAVHLHLPMKWIHGLWMTVQSNIDVTFALASTKQTKVINITTGSNRSLRSLGRAKARPLTKRYIPTMYEKYCADHSFKSDFKAEFVSLWDGWLGEENLHKLNEVTPEEWDKFNTFLRQLSQRYTLFSISHETKEATKIIDIEAYLSTYEQAMNKEASQFSAFIIQELSCAISEDWDHTYIIWHNGIGEIASLSPIIKACGLEHFGG